MSDPFTLAAQTAAAALGVDVVAQAPPADLRTRWPDYLKGGELRELMAAGRRAGTGEVRPSPELLRRAILRQALGLFHGGFDEHGVEFGGTRDCVEKGRSSRCRCAEDAVLEAAASVRDVDASVVAAVRARARVQHERFARRRRERLRARVEAVPRAAAVASRRVLGLETVGVSERFVSVRESEPLPRRVSAGRVRVSSVARGRVTSADVEGRELARKLGVEYSVSSWKALPIVDGKRSGS